MGEGREGIGSVPLHKRNYASDPFATIREGEREGERNETTENGSGFNSTLILAAKRTYRRDPLDNFKCYTGGWNISELHSWVCWMHRFCTPDGVNFMGA
ncbi:hypothetical protein IFM89_004902 [Coptis chinensis]|uniref:Uncharacterized protein n=1 Tax=Coptis chinensis TaxID=261450 RepID=A0A835M281_9MAGN|nr:hypothetical protein IFM89_004902 [Coptis chinensis]